jgi:hypothetical protein
MIGLTDGMLHGSDREIDEMELDEVDRHWVSERGCLIRVKIVDVQV